ncbi:acyl-CoA N-acyltransferase [Russula dissimulans]|nr:acyl-CoA N-acyltransferase [Russula dissimulans]
MENPSVSHPHPSTQWPTEEFVIRPLNSADIQNVRALHAELAPSSPALRPTFFHQLLTHQTHLCLIATLPSSDKPVACIATALHVSTSDLTSRAAPPPPIEVHVLALGVLPAFRRRRLATRLLRTAAAALRVLAAKAPQVPTSLVTAQAPTRVHASVARADESARAFWSHVGMREEESPFFQREPWIVGWRDTVSVAGPVLSVA